MIHLLCSENKLSTAWFSELLSDMSKRILGSQDLVRGHSVKQSIVAHTPALGRYDERYCFKIVWLNRTKLSVKLCQNVYRYNSMQNQYRLNF